MLRRFLNIVSLAFALLLAQQGAAWHALSHAHTATQYDDKQVPVEKCGQCIAYAHMGSALASAPPIIAVANIAPVQVALPPFAFTPVAQFYFLSRGPPRLV